MLTAYLFLIIHTNSIEIYLLMTLLYIIIVVRTTTSFAISSSAVHTVSINAKTISIPLSLTTCTILISHGFCTSSSCSTIIVSRLSYALTKTHAITSACSTISITSSTSICICSTAAKFTWTIFHTWACPLAYSLSKAFAESSIVVSSASSKTPSCSSARAKISCPLTSSLATAFTSSFITVTTTRSTSCSSSTTVPKFSCTSTLTKS
mmetsp:Transcript_27635/g.40817  ORF Transcript_27635/g.40817 Transcript_27635/m.40817 type:complete len:208 (-) Transcript_27635:19-642(-)